MNGRCSSTGPSRVAPGKTLSSNSGVTRWSIGAWAKATDAAKPAAAAAQNAAILVSIPDPIPSNPLKLLVNTGFQFSGGTMTAPFGICKPPDGVVIKIAATKGEYLLGIGQGGK
jgi:hypothetical protein